MKNDGQTTSQAHEVELRLRKMILDMDLGPGERLTERWAEAQLGASRTPIRAAMIRLQSDGLVRREGKSWMVAPLDLREIEQLFVYREVLETAALRLAGGAPDRAALEALLAQLDGCGPDMPKEAVHNVGTAFHIRLAELAGNDFITRAVVDAMTRLSRARWLDTEIEHQGWEEHRSIVRAIQDGDTETAVSLLSRHIGESRDRLLRILRDDRRSLRARGAVVT